MTGRMLLIRNALIERSRSTWPWSTLTELENRIGLLRHLILRQLNVWISVGLVEYYDSKCGEPLYRWTGRKDLGEYLK
jgi:hypothetical protein